MLQGRGVVVLQMAYFRMNRMTTELEARAAASPKDAELKRVAAEQRAACDTFSAGQFRFTAATAELKGARVALDELYPASMAELRRGEAFVFARYGHYNTEELAKFGVRTPGNLRRGKRRRSSATAPATPFSGSSSGTASED